MLPNLRIPDPARTEITPDTIVLQDLVASFKDVGTALADFEQTAETKYVSVVCGRLDALIEAAKDYKRRIRAVQYDLNQRHSAFLQVKWDGQKEAQEERKKQREIEKQKKREANRLLYAQTRGRVSPEERRSEFYRQKEEEILRQMGIK